MKNGYFTVNGEFENTIVIERSKFICSVKGIKDESEAKQFIEEIRKKHSLANHNCYAYIADEKGLVQKFSDAGEPQGTAGMPMLEVLKSKKIYKTVAVVTRYFGGIKLGAGGLVRAYNGSVADCLSRAKISDMQVGTIFSVTLEYDGYSILLKLLDNPAIKVQKTEFLNSVIVEFAVRADFVEKFKEQIIDAFNGKISLQEKDSGYYDFG